MKKEANERRRQAQEIHATVRMLRLIVSREHVHKLRHLARDHNYLELTLPQFNMLIEVREQGPITIKKLAKTLEVSSPSVSSMVDRLVELEMLVREQNPQDRREVLVRLSPQANQFVLDMEEHLLSSLEDLLEKLGADDAQRWCDVYARVGEVLLRDYADLLMSELKK